MNLENKKSFFVGFLVLLVQLAGYALVARLCWAPLASLRELLHPEIWLKGLSAVIWLLLAALPAIVAWKKRWQWRRLAIGIAILPAVAVLLLLAASMGLSTYRTYQARQMRKHLFDEPAKIEQIAGARLPDFRISAYDETFFPDDLLRRHSCRVNAEFTDMPSAAFYQQLDSLCLADSLHWQKGDGAYAYDSIYGRNEYSKLVLAIVLTKGAKDLEIRYDDCIDFTIKNIFEEKLLKEEDQVRSDK